jgi:hypothetical protein
MDKRTRITHREVEDLIQNVGAAFATRGDKYIDPNDPLGSKPTYHIHPDRHEPWQNAILRFRTLQEIADYAVARTEAFAHPDLAEEIMGTFWMTQED